MSAPDSTSARLFAAVPVFALLLVAAGCVGPLGSAGATQVTDAANATTVQVSATGVVEAEPDQALVRVAVLARADDAGVVRQRLAANASSVRSALSAAGVGDDDIRTVEFDIREERDRTPEGPEVVGFRGVHAFEITVANVSRVGEIIDVAVGNGADQVTGVEFTLADDTRRAARTAALRAAMADARADAETLAAAEDLQIVGVRSIAAGQPDVRPVRAEAALAAGDAGTQIETGPVTVTATVQVAYNATASGDGEA